MPRLKQNGLGALRFGERGKVFLLNGEAFLPGQRP
jgi:hypothetical protein